MGIDKLLKIKKVSNYIKNHKLLFTVLVLLFITFLAYGKTLQMYFWVDDWGTAFKMRFPEENPGNLGLGSYRYIGTPFIWLYPLLGLSAKAYFAVGLFQYFLASLAVYFFVKELIQKHSTALGAAAIFASGFIGSFAIYRLSNSYQLIGMTLFTLLTCWALVKHYRSGHSVFYWLALLLYIMTLEFFFLRSHGLVFIVLGIVLLYGISRINRKALLISLFKLAPFLSIYFYLYFLDPRVIEGRSLLPDVIRIFIKEKNFELLNNFLISFIKLIIPDPIIKKVYTLIAGFSKISLTQNTSQALDFKYLIPISLLFIILLTPRVISLVKKKKKNTINLVSAIFLILLFMFNVFSSRKSSSLWNPRGEDMFSAMLGGSFIIIAVSFALRLRKKEKKNARLILLGLIVVAATIITYFVNTPNVSLDSRHRYVPAGLVGTAMIYATVFSRFNKRFLYLLSVGLVSFCLIFLTNKEAAVIVRDQSIPDKQGYELILKEVPGVDQNSVFFVETQDKAIYKGRFLGGIGRLGIPTLFGFHGMIKMPVSYDHLYYWLSKDKASLDNTYTLYFGEDGYKNTTDTFRQLISVGQKAKALINWDSITPRSATRNGASLDTKTAVADIKEGVIGASPVMEVDVEYDSLMPSVLSFNMTTIPLVPQELKYPYYDFFSKFPYSYSVEQLAQIEPPVPIYSREQILLALRKESEYQNFLRNAKVKASTTEKTREAGYVIDDRADTFWSARHSTWNLNRRPADITIDLGYVKPIKELTWVNHYRLATPTEYTIYISNDGINWTIAKEVKDAPEKRGGEVVIEDMPGHTARYIKLSISDTFGGKGYAPAVDEIWVSEIDTKLDSKVQAQIIACPFCFIETQKDAWDILNIEKSIARMRVWWTTDGKESYYPPNSKEVPIFLDGRTHYYQIILPPQGTKYKKVKIDSFPVPLSVSINNASIRSLTLEELEKLGLIHEFADN